jgi:predicted enzyme related to lactoylglutathione lyase/uncharacterized protein YndB with AHSA1/START domain
MAVVGSYGENNDVQHAPPRVAETTDEVLAENVLEQLQQDLAHADGNSGVPSQMIELKSINMFVRLADISPHEAYEMLMDSEKHTQITGQEAKIGREVNQEFSAYDGHITGFNVELQKDRKIVQKWRMKDWPEHHHSLVAISFRKVANGTKVTLTQSGVPGDKYAFIWEGWYNFYWNKMGRIDEKEMKKNKKQKTELGRRDSNGDSLGSTPILHVEIPCKDMQRVMRFYGDVFGWTFKPWTDYYTLFNTRSKPGSLTGGFWLNDKDELPRDRFITLYIHVDDIGEYLERIKASGGEIVKEKTLAFEAVGYYAFFRDSEGNQMGLNSKV